MRPRTVRRFRLLVATVWLAAAVMFGAGVAKADPIDLYVGQNADTVCRVLDSFPTFNGIGGIADAVVNNTNLSYRDAGKVIAMSVAVACPWHRGLLDDYITVFGPRPVVA